MCMNIPAGPGPLSSGAIDDSLLLMLFWVLAGLSVLGLLSQRYGLQLLALTMILRSIYHLGIGNTLILLGTINVREALGSSSTCTSLDLDSGLYAATPSWG